MNNVAAIDERGKWKMRVVSGPASCGPRGGGGVRDRRVRRRRVPPAVGPVDADAAPADAAGLPVEAAPPAAPPEAPGASVEADMASTASTAAGLPT